MIKKILMKTCEWVKTKPCNSSSFVFWQIGFLFSFCYCVFFSHKTWRRFPLFFRDFSLMGKSKMKFLKKLLMMNYGWFWHIWGFFYPKNIHCGFLFFCLWKKKEHKTLEKFRHISINFWDFWTFEKHFFWKMYSLIIPRFYGCFPSSCSLFSILPKKNSEKKKNTKNLNVNLVFSKNRFYSKNPEFSIILNEISAGFFIQRILKV